MTPAANISTSVAPSDDLPEGWVELPVQKLIEKHFCGPSPDCEERRIQTDQEWGVLKTTAIVWDGWNEAAHKTLPPRFWGLDHLQVQHGDVLITKAGPRDRVAVVVHVTTHPKRIVVSGKMIALRPRKDAVVPQVLAGVLGLRKTQDYIHGRTTGMAESQVNFANTIVLEANVRVPREIPEQSRIAEILDTLDAAIQETEAVVAKLKQVKAGLLHDLLTRGLDEHGQLRDPDLHPEQFQRTPIGQIPRAWTMHRLTEIADISSGVTLAGDFRGAGSVELPYLRVANVQDGYLDLSDLKTVRVLRSEVEAFRLQVGDVLMNEGGDFDKLGRGAVWRGEIDLCLHQNHVFKVRPNQRRILSDFLNAVSGSRIGKTYFLNSSKQSTNLASINSTQLKAFLVPCPEIDEQMAIQLSLANADSLIASEQSKLSKLYSLKRGLAHDLLTGGVRVKLSSS